MSRNIKEIGKELMGKSLNSFHRKTGLTQLEKNNEMQDGILDGILSQVDDAYIEKTEQSNVIHLDGSGDGVVVLDSIEGNTMVNILKYKNIQWVDGRWNDYVRKDQLIQDLKTNTEYTIVVDVSNWNYNQGIILCCDDTNVTTYFKGSSIPITGNGRYIAKRTTKADFSTLNIYNILYSVHNPDTINGTCNVDMMIFEGDWTDKEIPPYFEGLQSSFEEKTNNEGKYEIEILSNNKNLYNVKDVNIGSWMNSGGATVSKINDNIVLNGTISDYFDFRTVQNSWNPNITKLINKLPVGTTLTMSNNLTSEKNTINYWSVIRDGTIKYFTNTLTIQKGDTEIGGFVRFQNGTVLNNTILKVQIEVNNKATNYTISKQNKIKLLMNEPLRGLPTGVKDRFVKIGGKLFIERKCGGIILDGSENTIRKHNASDTYTNTNLWRFENLFNTNAIFNDRMNMGVCDKFEWNANTAYEDFEHCRTGYNDNLSTHVFYIWLNKSKCSTVDEFRTWMSNNPAVVVYQLAEPYYEEVLNEYGEPILLEGYESGTLYIDSAIVPTTTVRYTPKMESFKTLKEVENNNIMLTNDVNDNIIPYMMDVDLMIMEKEMALMSHKNIRKMEVLDMTSMQKRTQEMLERLIKGKSLTEQECKTRVTTYLNAGKITDEQAEELMLLISEVYA